MFRSKILERWAKVNGLEFQKKMRLHFKEDNRIKYDLNVIKGVYKGKNLLVYDFPISNGRTSNTYYTVIEINGEIIYPKWMISPKYNNKIFYLTGDWLTAKDLELLLNEYFTTGMINEKKYSKLWIKVLTIGGFFLFLVLITYWGLINDGYR